jgi:hypothetical protein
MTASAATANSFVIAPMAKDESSFLYKGAAAISSLLLVGGAMSVLFHPFGPETTTLTEGEESPTTTSTSTTTTTSITTTTRAQEWKDGLLYDNPDDDEPTTCAFCRLYRQGPCRPYWRPFELCVKQKNESDDDNNNNNTEQSTTPTSNNNNNNCQAVSERFIMDCLSNYLQLYTLIDLQMWQDELFDEVELTERRAAFQDVWSLTPTTQDNDSTTNSTNIMRDTIPQRVEKILQNDLLYQHVQDTMAWTHAIRIDWSRWAKMVHVMQWKRSNVCEMIAREQQASREQLQQQQQQVRPVWWSTAPSLPSEGIDQIIDCIGTSTSTTTKEGLEQDLSSTTSCVPWPLQQQQSQSPPPAADENKDDSATTEPKEDNTKKKKPIGTAFWQLLDGNPVLVPITVTLPKTHPRQEQCQLQYAYCRDADTGVLLGYYYPTAAAAEASSSDHNTVEENKANEEHTPTNDTTTPSILATSTDTISNVQEDSATNQEELQAAVQPESASSTVNDSSTTNKNEKEKDKATVEMLVHLLPGRTGSIQLFGAYSSDDSYEFLETPPISVVDAIFIIPTTTTPRVNDDDDYEVVVHDTPQGVDMQDRMERYQILHNFCKYQSMVKRA